MPSMTPLEGARAWVAAWRDAWSRRAPDVIAARYRAVITATDGSDTTIHGVSLLRIGPDGLVEEHRDTWTELEGDHGVALVKEDSQ